MHHLNNFQANFLKKYRLTDFGIQRQEIFDHKKDWYMHPKTIQLSRKLREQKNGPTFASHLWDQLNSQKMFFSKASRFPNNNIFVCTDAQDIQISNEICFAENCIDFCTVYKREQ